MILFLIIVLSVHALVNFYIFMRGWQALEGVPGIKPYYIAVFSVLFISYILGRILMSAAPGALSSVMMWIGSFWLAFMLYFFLLIVLLDLVRVFNHWFHFYPGFITLNYAKVKLITLVVSVLLISAVVLIGYLNALRPRVKKVEISIPKNAGKLKELRIALVSDIHLGTIVGRNRLSYIVERINEMKPDIVLLAGDVVDEDIDPVIRLNLGEMLRALRSKYGTYAVPGNHEYIGGAERSIAYLEAHGVKVLRDATTHIDSSFLLVGRDDKDRRRVSGTGSRADLGQLLYQENLSQPVILLDHQPFHLEQAVEAGVDLQLSGHTHAGQIWPLNYITRGLFEVDHGYLQKGNSQFYVSNGAGTWGPPIRLGNSPEIVELIVKFR